MTYLDSESDMESVSKRIEPAELHPFVQGLIMTLPTPKTEWPIESRKKWLQAASDIFDLIYESGDDSRGSLKIEIRAQVSRVDDLRYRAATVFAL